MKGVIQAYAFFVLWVSLSLSFMGLISFDHHQYIHQVILKQALNETALELREKSNDQRINEYHQILVEALRLRKPVGLNYEVEIMGFYARPLALRVKLNVLVHEQLTFNTYSFDETIIEVHDEN